MQVGDLVSFKTHLVDKEFSLYPRELHGKFYVVLGTEECNGSHAKLIRIDGSHCCTAYKPHLTIIQKSLNKR